MDYEKLERLARMIEPFGKAGKMVEAIPAAVRLASGLPRVNPAVPNLNRIQELTGKASPASSQWKNNAIHANDFPIVSQLSAGNQQAMALASQLSKSFNVSNLAATRVLDSLKASSIVVSKAVLEFTERNRILGEKVTKRFKLLPEAFIVLGNHGWYLNLEFELGRAVQLLGMLPAGESREVDECLAACYHGK
jgi:hypothetical protein